jgi:kynurenine formamidase
MNLIDLTHTFDDNMPVYPGDACSRLYQSAFIAKDGCSDHRIDSGMHVGTHMDAPLHMIDGAAYICDIPLPQFTGTGHMVDARGKNPITANLLKNHTINKGDIVLVRTDWSLKFRAPDYYTDYPEIAEDFAHALVKAGISLIILDTPSPDREPFLIHKILLAANVLIVENATNFATLAPYPNFKIHAYPVKYKADGAPVRVIAEITT